MPNHVHVVVQPRDLFGLAWILHSWKSYSGQMANRLLGRRGAFWQREYYDHLIRDGEELGKAIRYTAENPVEAGLADWRWVWVAADWS
jgi:REP element-mobilizing transposase RayT